jgi:hypothetical protein
MDFLLYAAVIISREDRNPGRPGQSCLGNPAINIQIMIAKEHNRFKCP